MSGKGIQYVYFPIFQIKSTFDDFNLIDLQEVLKVIDEKPENLELVLTGRYAHPDIVRSADYVTEMIEIKHPYQLGVQARKGVDF